MFRLLALGMLLSFWLVPSNVDAQSGKPCLAQKIYVAELGDGDGAARFRSLLERQLSKKGFTIADSQEKADAVLSGAVSVSGSDSNGTVNFERAEIKGKSGEQLWRGNFFWKYRNSFSFFRSGKVRSAVGDVATNIKENCK